MDDMSFGYVPFNIRGGKQQQVGYVQSLARTLAKLFCMGWIASCATNFHFTKTMHCGAQWAGKRYWSGALCCSRLMM
jgi:hypothetical protein